MRGIYLRADPTISGRVMVPILSDKAMGTIVSNESSAIIGKFNSAFDHLTHNRDDDWPGPRRDEIELVNTGVDDSLNSGCLPR